MARQGTHRASHLTSSKEPGPCNSILLGLPVTHFPLPAKLLSWIHMITCPLLGGHQGHETPVPQKCASLLPMPNGSWGYTGDTPVPTLRARSLRGRGKWLLDLSRTSAPWGGVGSRESPTPTPPPPGYVGYKEGTGFGGRKGITPESACPERRTMCSPYSPGWQEPLGALCGPEGSGTWGVGGGLETRGRIVNELRWLKEGTRTLRMAQPWGRGWEAVHSSPHLGVPTLAQLRAGAWGLEGSAPQGQQRDPNACVPTSPLSADSLPRHGTHGNRC